MLLKCFGIHKIKSKAYLGIVSKGGDETVFHKHNSDKFYEISFAV